MQQIQMAQSIIIKAPNFQKDVIIPQIYDIDNIKLIQRCKYPKPPKNKVLELKKQKFAKVIQGIINKPPIISYDREKKSKSVRKNSQNPEKYGKVIMDLTQSMLEAKLTMEMDERLGEIIANMQQNLLQSTQKIQGALSKVGRYLKDKQKQQKMKQVDEYIVNICDNKSKLRIARHSSSSKTSMSGYVEQMNNMSKSGIFNRTNKKRAQTAHQRRESTTEEFMERQSKSRLLTRSTANIRTKSNIENQRVKSRELISMINVYMDEQKKLKRGLREIIGNMNRQWTENGQLRKTFVDFKSATITHETLTLLKEKRIKTASLNRIDNEYFRK